MWWLKWMAGEGEVGVLGVVLRFVKKGRADKSRHEKARQVRDEAGWREGLRFSETFQGRPMLNGLALVFGGPQVRPLQTCDATDRNCTAHR